MSLKDQPAFPTRKEFESYERVRERGHWNMFTQASSAANEARLSVYRYWEVLEKYNECRKRHAELEKPAQKGEGK